MGRRPALVTQADVARALRAIKQSGLPHHMVEITKDGTIRIVPPEGKPSPEQVVDDDTPIDL